MSHTKYWLVANGIVIGAVNDSYYIVPMFDMDPTPSTHELLNAPDNPGMQVIPLREHFDSAAAYEGDVAPPEQPRLVMTRELLDLFTERRDEIEDGDSTLMSCEFNIDGVRVILD